MGSSQLIELAPSILSADFAHLADQVQGATEGGGTVIHVDVMEGHFVPNITVGAPVVKSLRKASKLPLDCHLSHSSRQRQRAFQSDLTDLRLLFPCVRIHR